MITRKTNPNWPLEKDLIEAIERVNCGTENIGFCTACGEENGCCEPDMRRGPCEACDANAVYGAEELLLRGWYR